MDAVIEIIKFYTPWIVTYGLITAGLVGAFIPIIPSHLIILLAGVAHHLMLKPDSGLGITSFIILALLLIGSQLFETFSGSVGSKWFGGTKWGTIGAMVGILIGIIVIPAPFGFILGPLIGALLCEKFFGKQSLKDATSSGIGSSVGVLTGLAVRLVIAFVMSIYLLLDIYLFK